MKKQILSLVSLLAFSSAFAQNPVLFGDMNNDHKVSVSDVTTLANMIANDQTNIPLFDPYYVDNSKIVGKWYETPIHDWTFNADGTASHNEQGNPMDTYTYNYYPNICKAIIISDSNGQYGILEIFIIDEDRILVSNPINTQIDTHTRPIQFVTKITLSSKKLFLKQGTFEALSATISPDYADNKDFTWSSSNETIAKVADGIVMAISPGYALITATASDGGHTAGSCSVYVYEESNPYESNEYNLQFNDYHSNWKYYPESADWYCNIGDTDTFFVSFDIINNNVDSPVGTYTIEDLDLTYSFVQIAGESLYYEEVTCIVSETENGYNLDAEITTTDGKKIHVVVTK